MSIISAILNRSQEEYLSNDGTPSINKPELVNEDLENNIMEVEADIVVIHGIAAHPTGNWESRITTSVCWLCGEDPQKDMTVPFGMIESLPPLEASRRRRLVFRPCCSRRARNIPARNMSSSILRQTRISLGSLGHWTHLISEWVLDLLGLICTTPLAIVGVRLAEKLEKGINIARLILLTSLVLANMWYMNLRLQRRKNHRQVVVNPHRGKWVGRTREGAFILVNCDEGNRYSRKRGPSLSTLIIDWCTIVAGGLAAFVMVSFLSPLDQLPVYGLDLERFIQIFGSSDLFRALLERPNLVAYVVAVLVYSAAGIYHLVHKPRYWADFGLMAIICSVFMGSWLGRQAMVNTLILGALLSLVCAKMYESSTNRRHSYPVVKEQGQYRYDLEKVST
ncbi:hypothetical protein QBC40DRAFT_270773 [Triangularia verruculosa]|uniref:Transmembrane protein n=1 Tax=Triangularia verruculosa TaxID=2587418 RepID=A0AAN7B0V6_9PEZI|nr:hypothetical protein QBC40DRAFT_270773 [Triangularia verruculosa]